jgi:hypothetical protein
MRCSPEHAILSPYQMPTHMMQARGTPRIARCIVLLGCGEFRQARMHFNMIQQWRAMSLKAFAIENASRNRHTPRCPLGIEQQEKAKEQRHVVCDRGKRGACYTLVRVQFKSGLAVIVQPFVVELESNSL